MKILSILILAIAGMHRSSTAADLNQAVSHYHRAQYDSALIGLQKLAALGPRKKRDSLALYQYLGMASAQLGRDSSAIDYFGTVLALDSLFQFPKNEDPAITRAFSTAWDIRHPPASLDPPAAPREGAPSPPPLPVGQTWASLATGMPPPRPGMTLVYGAIPLGTGWMVRKRPKHGLVLGLLQGGGMLFSLYASHEQNREQGDDFGVMNKNELARVERWQWAQRISLSTALGAYLFSIIASVGE
jgi:hypothetical protein